MIRQSGAIEIDQPIDAPSMALPVQVHSDEQLIALWLHGRPAATVRAYSADVRDFLAHAGGSISGVTLGAVQAYLESLAAMMPSSRVRKVSSIKGLLSFAHGLGYVASNVGAAVKLSAVKRQLVQRALDEDDAHRMISLEPNPRNAALLRLIYDAGLRISEVAWLCWRDLHAQGHAGEVVVFGAGRKTRVVPLSASLWRALVALRGCSGPDRPVFVSAQGGALDRSQVHRVVKAAAARAGLSPDVSSHWLRRAHASRVLSRGAPPPVLRSEH